MNTAGRADDTFASLSRGSDYTHYASWMLNVISIGIFVQSSFLQSSCICKGTIGDLKLPIVSQRRMHRSCHQLPIRLHFPPVDVLQEERHFFWNFYNQRQRHLMVTALHVTWGGGIIIICPDRSSALTAQTGYLLFNYFKYFRGPTGCSCNHKYFNRCFTKGGSLALVWYWSRGQQQIYSTQKTTLSYTFILLSHSLHTVS